MTDPDIKAEADREFDRQHEAYRAHAEHVKTFASDGMKAPALVSAAGVAAALGFYSANYARLSATPEALLTFNDILFWLFLSLFLTVCAPGMAYFSQIAYASSIYANEWHYDRPFIRATRWSTVYERTGDACRWTAVALVFSSIVCLGIGGYHFLKIVQ